jgi:hypothetical protein
MPDQWKIEDSLIGKMKLNGPNIEFDSSYQSNERYEDEIGRYKNDTRSTVLNLVIFN